ncbi:50S ribosomal protein L1 [Candidatus Woesearchaeota archaeon]|nr:50S ribosomal protein L1 [Candidatus Woesearchaeota archaeon]
MAIDKASISKALKQAKEKTKSRKFAQTVELIVNLNLNIKTNKVDFFVDLHYEKGKKISVCALVGPELQDNAKANCDHFVPATDFPKYQKDKKLTKKLAKQYDMFIAQANIMPKIAAAFGRYFGPLNKMPNPKAGCVVPPNANLAPLVERLHKKVRVKAIRNPVIQVGVANEKMEDEKIIDNIQTVYKALLANLPAAENNVKGAFVKLTMGPAVKIE